MKSRFPLRFRALPIPREEGGWEYEMSQNIIFASPEKKRPKKSKSKGCKYSINCFRDVQVESGSGSHSSSKGGKKWEVVSIESSTERQRRKNMNLPLNENGPATPTVGADALASPNDPESGGFPLICVCLRVCVSRFVCVCLRVSVRVSVCSPARACPSVCTRKLSGL